MHHHHGEIGNGRNCRVNRGSTPSGKEIMNHKRGKRKNARAGCLLCKPNKMNGWNKDKLGHTGFGKLKRVLLAKKDQRDGV